MKTNQQFENTAKDTPWQNDLAELNFIIVAEKARAMMIHAYLNQETNIVMQRGILNSYQVGLPNNLDIDGELQTRFESFGKKILNSTGSFDYLVKWAWTRLV